MKILCNLSEVHIKCKERRRWEKNQKKKREEPLGLECKINKKNGELKKNKK